MKRFCIVLFLIASFFLGAAQSVDYEILGFAGSDGNPISVIELSASQDLKPRVILKNNGPDAVAVTDTVIFDITYNQSYPAMNLKLTGTELHSVGQGEQVIVDLDRPIWTASVMDEYGLTACDICYEVRIVGAATDPVYTNNRACIDVTRALGVDAYDPISVSLFPNPASYYVVIQGAENAQLQIFDMAGRMVYTIENALENQWIDISSLSEGLYFVRVFDGKNSIARKLNVIR